MNKKYFFICLLSFLMIGTSCNDYLDINEDPNKATVAPPGPIFTGVITQYSTNRVIDLGPTLSTGAQFWSGGGTLGVGVFTRPEQYNFSINVINNTWRAYYREIQKNLALAIIGAREAEDLNAEAQCKIFQAFTFYSTTVLYGDVPYSEAIAVDFSIPEIKNLNPKFDPQQEVLEGVLDILDEAISLIDESGTTAISNNDLIYTGDMSKWLKFAKSLKFRTLLTMVDADPSKAEAISRMMTEGGMLGKGDNAEFPFFAVAGNQNPFWGTLNTFAGGANFFYFAGDEMVKLMQSLNDPRLAAYFQPFPGGGSAEEVTGAPAGVQSFPTNPWVLTTSTGGDVSLVRPDAPDVLFSYSEQAFLEAEAMVRGFASGGKQEADTKLRDGIRDAMEQYNISSDDIDDYLSNSIPDLVTLSDDEAREVIAEQIWIDCIIRPLEGFTHWRRAEIPELPVPEGASLTNFLRRLPYPIDEVAANNNAPEVLPTADVKLWFDQ